MMENLNDDCQLEIIGYLELEDQQALYEATENLSSRLNSNIIYAWQHKTEYVLIPKELNKNLKQLEIFLRSIAPTVQSIDLRGVTFKLMAPWMGHRFPSVRELNYKLNLNDDWVKVQKLLVELFPGVSSAYPIGKVNYNVAGEWMQLRKLDLTECWDINKTEISRLPMLEELIICQFIQSGDPFATSVASLPRLQVLSLNTGESFMNSILDLRCLDIEELVFSDSIADYDLAKLQQVKNLRKLTLSNEFNFPVDSLQSLVSALPVLEQLHVIDCQFWCNENDLWKTIDMCPSLKVLNITDVHLHDNFFDQSRRFMENVLRKRSTPLTLHWHDTGNNEDLIRQCFQHCNLKLSFESLSRDIIPLNSVQIKLVPLKK
ncbi:GH11441 [Drosophila grimshawi]|uniref:GH11441 n=1 Tax=Drosophila grimshawi TaxID=7222 RepID=B4JAD6_DROGR|nr:GH11441 [Drosophila grimshawi]